jgi:hypothetical protein
MTCQRLQQACAHLTAPGSPLSPAPRPADQRHHPGHPPHRAQRRAHHHQAAPPCVPGQDQRRGVQDLPLLLRGGVQQVGGRGEGSTACTPAQPACRSCRQLLGCLRCCTSPCCRACALLSTHHDVHALTAHAHAPAHPQGRVHGGEAGPAAGLCGLRGAQRSQAGAAAHSGAQPNLPAACLHAALAGCCTLPLASQPLQVPHHLLYHLPTSSSSLLHASSITFFPSYMCTAPP